MKARELGRRSVVVGDDVLLAGDVSGRPDALARIVRVRPRRDLRRRPPAVRAEPQSERHDSNTGHDSTSTDHEPTNDRRRARNHFADVFTQA